MDIHKAKPWHGWRELLKEIGTIVIGVLIALAGEQAVENLHWREQADAADAALKLAFAREVDNVALREAEGDCAAQRLTVLSAILQRATQDGRLPATGSIGHPAFTPWTVGVWDALVASQTVSHLPRQKTVAYTTIVQTTRFLAGLSDREEDQWTILDSMVGPGRRLSDVEAEQLRLALAQAANSNRLMRRTSRKLRDDIKATGLLEASAFASAVQQGETTARTAALCLPIPAAASGGPA